jgi:acetyl esterase
MTEPFVRPDVAGFLAFLNSQPGPKTHEVAAPEARQMMIMMAAIAEEARGDIAVVRDPRAP